MRKMFMKYLGENHNMTLVSPSGSRGSSQDYAFRVAHICKIENIGWETLAANINVILPKYERGGEQKEQGKRSHESYINALKYFRLYVGEQVANKTTPKTQNKRWKLF